MKLDLSRSESDEKDTSIFAIFSSQPKSFIGLEKEMDSSLAWQWWLYPTCLSMEEHGMKTSNDVGNGVTLSHSLSSACSSITIKSTQSENHSLQPWLKGNLLKVKTK